MTSQDYTRYEYLKHFPEIFIIHILYKYYNKYFYKNQLRFLIDILLRRWDIPARPDFIVGLQLL